MLRHYFALLMMIYNFADAMEQDTKLEVDSLSWPDIHIRHSKPWFKSLCNWAQCYYRVKAHYDKASKVNGENKQRFGFTIMQCWVQWCQPELKKIIGDPDELYYKYGLYDRRLLNDALRKNKYCLGKFLIAEKANPLLDCGLRCTMFYANTMQWAKLFLSVVGYDANRVSKDFSLVMHVTFKNYPEEILKFYLEHNGDPNFANKEGNSLHWLAKASGEYQNVDALLKKAELLITHKVKINELNQGNGDTPLDEAYNVLNYAKTKKNKIHQQPSCEKLITLLRNHGAKTAQELKAEQQ